MATLNTLFVIGLIIIGCVFDASYAIQVFFVSLLLALIPLATSKFFFALPILIIAYSFIFGDSTFAWLCIIYAPFHWLAFTSLVVDAIKSVVD